MRQEEAEQEAPNLTLPVALADAGARLDAYLTARIPDWSRSRIQRLIEDGDVLVDGRASKPSYKLRGGEEIEVELAAAAPAAFAPEDIPLDVVYEDDDLVVVNKPAGLVVHPAPGSPSGTLANALAFRFRVSGSGFRVGKSGPSSAGGKINFNPQPGTRNSKLETRDLQSYPRPGIVHRLDKDTSGLVAVAKTEAAHENLADQFRAREVFKSYVALVHGRVAEDSGTIDQPLARDHGNRTRMGVVRGGRPALSIYRVRRRYERFTLLDVEIKTGRTHQIRVHLQWLKHPVVGDAVYGGGRDKTVTDVRLRARIISLNRQFLHAEQLGFRHPRTGQPLSFTAPLPQELSQILEELGKQESGVRSQESE